MLGFCFFPSSRDTVGINLLGGKPVHTNGDIFSNVFDRHPDHHPDELDCLAPRRDYFPAAITRPIRPRANLFQNECTDITKAILFSPHLNAHLLDKEDVTNHKGNTVHFQASQQSQYKGEWPYGLNTFIFVAGLQEQVN